MVTEHLGIIIDYERDNLLPEQGKAMLTRKGFYKRDGENSPQESFARAATCFSFGDYEFAQRIYDYASKHWFTYASPPLSNSVEVDWPSFSEDQFEEAGDWLEENVDPDGMPISCFAAGTPIITKNGVKNIEDINVDDEVLTHKGRFRKVEATRVSRSDDIYELQCSRNTTKLYVTGNHRMLTNRGWVRVDELKKGYDLIAQSQRVDREVECGDLVFNFVDKSKVGYNSGSYIASQITNNVVLDVDLAWALGFWFAEGSTSDNGQIRVTHGDVEPCEKWQKIISEKFGLNGRSYKSGDHNWYNGEVNSVQLQRNFDEIFGKGCKDKSLPDEWMVVKWSPEIFESFLEGFYLGDGFKTTDYKMFEITNVKLGSQIALKLMENDYSVSCQYRKYIHHNKSKNNGVYNIVVSYKRLNESKSSIRNGITMTDGLTYVTINSLTKVEKGEIDVYDIQVKEDESFSAAGLIAHNCFLALIGDNKRALVDTRAEVSWLSMMGGGVGIYTEQRSPDEKSTGVMQHMRGYDADTLSYKQTASRRGSIAAYIDVTHPEIIPFLQMRNPVGGDSNKKCFNMNNAVNITDDFMEKVILGQQYELIDPKHGATGKFLDAREVWEMIMELRFETGEPYICFIDTINRNLPEWITRPLYHVKQSNLC